MLQREVAERIDRAVELVRETGRLLDGVAMGLEEGDPRAAGDVVARSQPRLIRPHRISEQVAIAEPLQDTVDPHFR